MKKVLSIILITICGIFIFYLQFNYKKQVYPISYYQVYLDNEIVGVIKSKDEFDEYVSNQGELIKKQVQDYQNKLETLNEVDKIISSKVKKSKTKDTYLKYQEQYNSLSQYVSEDGQFDEIDKSKVIEILNTYPIEYTSEITVYETSISNYSTFLEQLDAYLVKQKEEYITYLNNNIDKLGLSESEKYYLDLYNTSSVKDTTYIKQVYMSNYVEENGIYLHTDDIYKPLGVTIQKIVTYSKEADSVEEVYNYIVSKKACTVEGYQFRIKNTSKQILSSFSAVGGVMLDDYNKIISVNDEDVLIYVTDPQVFEDAINKLEYVFVDADVLDAYKAGNQAEIETVGTKLLDVYVEEEITIKQTNISVNEKIFNDSDELSSYLLYGEDKDIKKVKVSAEDTISSITYKYGISFEEFLLSNPEFTSVNNIFYDNQEVVIAKTDPKINIVVEQYIVEDMNVEFETIEEYDNSLNQGMEVVKQKGEDGVERVGQNVRSVNGTITFVEPVSNTTIKSPKNKIISIGTKVIPNVGSLSSWGWPTNKNYRISSYFGYRTSPITGGRELHAGIDIAGTGLGSPVYASNNGTVMIKTYVYSYGNYIIINHNNGYYSTYAHMNGFASGIKVGSTVSRGQIIGYVGSTGYSTGPHLHFEIRTCPRYSCVVNPLPYLRKK